MSTVRVNQILDSAGGNTAQINGMTPTALSLQGFRNRIINGAMVIDQRNAGASVTVSSSVYTLDRWAADQSGLNPFTVQRSTTVPAGFNNSLAITMGTGATIDAGDYAFIRQVIEGFNVADLGLGTANAVPFTLSFWVRSSVTGTFGVSFRNSAANATYCSTYTISAANTWEYKTVTVPAITSGTWTTDNTAGIGVFFDLGVGSTYNGTAGQLNTGANYFGVTGTTKLAATTGATFYITGVQLEAGSVATPFERRPYGTELALCQRYYEIGETTFVNNSLTETYLSVPFIVTKRSSPTVTRTGAGSVTGGTSGTTVSTTNNSNFYFYKAGTGYLAIGGNWAASAEL